MRDGIALELLVHPAFESETAKIQAAIAQAVHKGWAKVQSARLVPTLEGLRFADLLAELFF
jgi:hypothetical protein